MFRGHVPRARSASKIEKIQKKRVFRETEKRYARERSADQFWMGVIFREVVFRSDYTQDFLLLDFLLYKI